MSIVSFLFRQPVVLEDAFFGRLVLDGSGQSGSSCCFYAAKVMFHPTDTTIECMIDTADATGPARTQQSFFQHVEQIYASVLPEIVRVIENDSRLLAAGSPFVNFTSTHRLAGITIPEQISSAVNWEIWFEPIYTSQWGYSVSVDMIGDVPQAGIGISAQALYPTKKGPPIGGPFSYAIGNFQSNFDYSTTTRCTLGARPAACTVSR